MSIRAKTSETNQSFQMEVEPSAAAHEEGRQQDSPPSLDVIAALPPPPDHQLKKRKFAAVEGPDSSVAVNPFSAVKLQDVGREEVLKIESCYQSWTGTNVVVRAMEVAGTATQVT
jgi:hypothetical protein